MIKRLSWRGSLFKKKEPIMDSKQDLKEEIAKVDEPVKSQNLPNAAL